MGKLFEVIDTYVTNPSTTLTATTPFSGDTLTVRNFDTPNRAWLVNTWYASATAGAYRIHSPFLHDNVQGIRFRTVAASVRSLLSGYEKQPLIAQDALIIEQSGGGSETDGVSILNWYDNVPGADPRLADWPSVQARIVQLVNQEVAVGSGAAVGTRATGVAINATFDLMKANTDYALLGYESDATGLSVGFRGPDTSNFRVGGPMTTERIETRDWFTRLSNDLGEPCIPIINSANKSGTFVDNAQVVTGVAANITLIMAQLSP